MPRKPCTLEQAAANGEPYDAAVLDMLMPGKSRLQLARTSALTSMAPGSLWLF